MRIPDSGDPRLDPEFLRKHGGRRGEGFETPPKGKAHETKRYTLIWDPKDGGKVREVTVKTKALSRFLIVGVIGGRGVILFRCKRVEAATEIMKNQQPFEDWRWLRVIDQKTKEILVMREGELVREK